MADHREYVRGAVEWFEEQHRLPTVQRIFKGEEDDQLGASLPQEISISIRYPIRAARLRTRPGAGMGGMASRR